MQFPDAAFIIMNAAFVGGFIGLMVGASSWFLAFAVGLCILSGAALIISIMFFY